MGVSTLVLLAGMCLSMDLNGDCAVDVADVSEAISCVWTQDMSCDFNADGNVNVSDVQLVIQAVSGTVLGQAWDCTGWGSCTECTEFRQDTGGSWSPALGTYKVWEFWPESASSGCADVGVDHIDYSPLGWQWEICDPAPTGCANCIEGLSTSMELSLHYESDSHLALCARPFTPPVL